LPDFISDELEAYRRRGMLEHGVAHFACQQDGESKVVAFDRIAAVCTEPATEVHALRYHGVLAAHANALAEVVRGRRSESAEPTQIPLSFAGARRHR
jgi:hypothetical protein